MIYKVRCKTCGNLPEGSFEYDELPENPIELIREYVVCERSECDSKDNELIEVAE